MRKATSLTLLIAGSTLLAACGSSGGLVNRDRPDEFAVQRQAPLVIPPDFALVPPAPGAPRPTESSAAQETLVVIFGGSVKLSPAEQNALEQAGEADPGIRSSVGDPQTNTVEKGQITQAIVAAPEGDGAEAQAVIPNN